MGLRVRPLSWLSRKISEEISQEVLHVVDTSSTVQVSGGKASAGKANMQKAEIENWAKVVDTTQRRGDLEDQILEILMGRFPVADLGALAAESEIIADALIAQRRGF